MNLILFPQQKSPVFQIFQDNPRYYHIKDILKSKSQDELMVGHINGKIGKARVLSVNDERIEFEVLQLDKNPPKPIPITLILALPRPPMLQRLLAAVTSLGIKRIYLIQTNRVEKSYWNSHILDPEVIHTQLILGLEQAKDTILPEVKLIKDFKLFIQDELPEISCDSLRLLAHPDSSGRLCPANIAQPVTLFVGPEGGLVSYEVESLKQIGFEMVHLGGRILRVETAVVALLAKIIDFS